MIWWSADGWTVTPAETKTTVNKPFKHAYFPFTHLRPNFKAEPYNKINFPD